MSETATHERGGVMEAEPRTTAPGSWVFPPEEEASLHAADVSAGRAIVCLLLGIFTIGLLMYLVICFSVG